jgi:hypothetical protein
MKGIFEKVMWVVRATTFGVGLAVTLALVFGVATMALAAVPGDLGYRSGKVLLHRVTSLAHRARKGGGEEAAHEGPPTIDSRRPKRA